MTYFLFRAQQRGGHVHVGVWGGSYGQAQNKARPKLGDLIMGADQWDDLKQQLLCGRETEASVEVEDLDNP